jgi:glutathione S-transferase
VKRLYKWGELIFVTSSSHLAGGAFSANMYQLVLGNRNYSSWSMRGWMLLKLAGVEFTELSFPLYGEDARAKVRNLGGQTGLVPVLIAGQIAIWDSLAIAEYLYEEAPQIWPAGRLDRARARSLAAEMHSGFLNLRMQMPCNMRAEDCWVELSDGLKAEISRISDIWARATGPWLCGEFCAADIMFAPVVTRFRTYGVELGEAAAAYARRLLDHPFSREWLQFAAKEPMVEKYERPRRSA